ncbi:Pre-rRNA-processing protein TSR2-like protein [Bienertia sinuspersici]
MQVLSAEAIPQFQEGISLTLSKWWALQIAVENCWGGPHSRDKALELSSRVFDFFYKPNRREPIYIDDLELLLEEGLESFNTVADDGSIEEVAEKLMVMHEECLEGDYKSIQKLKEVKSMPVPRVNQEVYDSDEDEVEDDDSMRETEASDMMVDSSGSLPSTNHPQIQKNDGRHQPMPDAEDGWTVVPPRKNRGRKN